jgi:hypothetical protein
VIALLGYSCAATDCEKTAASNNVAMPDIGLQIKARNFM